MDVVYLFTWILLWLMLTLKREWSFNVAHKVHQMYALQVQFAYSFVVAYFAHVLFKYWQSQ
ncbi:unnamed protein product [Haemonchus placei]|uniref:Elongation of very long chain fatty acids protein n=1 Tax=Haemonchus placei TaxID=6290 RepID=A0A0N4VX98_HAEPC|nr:unnamed protein product [Haemonchus placei]